MFHCNGWCFPWTVTALAGTHVCLRRVEAARKAICDAIEREHGVTRPFSAAAPVVMNTLLHARGPYRGARPGRRVAMMTAGAAPPAAVIMTAWSASASASPAHVYGLTEVYGPAVICAWHDEWDALSADERARLKARQGVQYPVLRGLMVADPDSLAPVPSDGSTMGEVFMRGNIVMKGYLKNPKATEDAFAGGWFHTGDLGVRHEDGYIEIKDRSKDIIISGGENISTIEVEDALYRHPSVLEAAVVARPDPHWGETPCAFVTPEATAPAPTPPRSSPSAANTSSPFQGAAPHRDLRSLAQDLDGKNPEIRAPRAREGGREQRLSWRAVEYRKVPSHRRNGDCHRPDRRAVTLSH